MSRKSYRGKAQLKLPFGVTQEFLDDLNSSEAKSIKEKLVSLQKHLNDTEHEIATREEIQDAKALVKLTLGPYQDTRKSLRNRLKCSIKRLEELGAC